MQNELDNTLLEKIFQSDEAMDDSHIPQLPIPQGLQERLHAISGRVNRKTNKRFLLPAMAGCVAASLLLTIALHFYFEQQRGQTALQAQRELRLTFEYMAKANARVVSRIDKPLIRASLMQVLETATPQQNPK